MILTAAERCVVALPLKYPLMEAAQQFKRIS